MPPLSRRTRSPSLEIQEVRPVVNKRRRAIPSSSPGSRRSARLQPPPTTINLIDDSADEDSEEQLFVSQPKKVKLDVDETADQDALFFPDTSQRALDDDVIDLVGNDAPAAPAPEPAPPKKPGRVEFAAFQCAICMDNATNLAVTHCGHMFCSECLQSALSTEATRNKCPICRQKVETRDRDTYNTKTKGFWHLELKPMTANKKGKQAAR